ncbi:hypothetical protein ACP4OV_011672 [Aristida adscensionis]
MEPLRRPAPPADPPLHRLPRSLPLPSALVPPKKRRVLRTPPKVATPIPPPDTPAAPTRARRRRSDAVPAPAASVGRRGPAQASGSARGALHASAAAPARR